MKRWIVAAGAVVVAAFAYVAPVALLIVLPTAITLGLVAWVMWGGAATAPRTTPALSDPAGVVRRAPGRMRPTTPGRRPRRR